MVICWVPSSRITTGFSGSWVISGAVCVGFKTVNATAPLMIIAVTISAMVLFILDQNSKRSIQGVEREEQHEKTCNGIEELFLCRVAEGKREECDNEKNRKRAKCEHAHKHRTALECAE